MKNFQLAKGVLTKGIFTIRTKQNLRRKKCQFLIFLKKEKFNTIKIYYPSKKERTEDGFFCDIYFRDNKYAYTVTLGLDKIVQSVLYYDYTLKDEDDIKEYPFELVA